MKESLMPTGEKKEMVTIVGMSISHCTEREVVSSVRDQ